MIRFHALGGLTVTDGHGGELGIGGSRQRRLLAMLLIHRNAVVSVDRLADAVFAGDPTPAASTTLRSYVARTRRLVDGEGLYGEFPDDNQHGPDEKLHLPSFHKLIESLIHFFEILGK